MLKNVTLNYDIPSWLVCGQESSVLENYKGKFFYSVVVTDYMRERLKNFKLMNRNPELSLQILYFEGLIKDFWPLWIKNDLIKNINTDIHCRQNNKKIIFK